MAAFSRVCRGPVILSRTTLRLQKSTVTKGAIPISQPDVSSNKHLKTRFNSKLFQCRQEGCSWRVKIQKKLRQHEVMRVAYRLHHRKAVVDTKALVNVDFGPATFVGLLMIGAGAALYQVRTVRPEASKDGDIFFSSIGLLCGGILCFQGWRLDPLLLFGQILTVSAAIAFGAEAIQLRQKSKQMDQPEDMYLPAPWETGRDSRSSGPSRRRRNGGEERRRGGREGGGGGGGEGWDPRDPPRRPDSPSAFSLPGYDDKSPYPQARQPGQPRPYYTDFDRNFQDQVGTDRQNWRGNQGGWEGPGSQYPEDRDTMESSPYFAKLERDDSRSFRGDRQSKPDRYAVNEKAAFEKQGEVLREEGFFEEAFQAGRRQQVSDGNVPNGSNTRERNSRDGQTGRRGSDSSKVDVLGNWENGSFDDWDY